MMGKLSGRNAFKLRLQELGVTMDSESEINNAFINQRIWLIARVKFLTKTFWPWSAKRMSAQSHDRFGFVSLAQHSETGEMPQATVIMTMDGKEVTGQSNGNGPVDASLKAIEINVKSGAEMVLYSVNAISGSTREPGR